MAPDVSSPSTRINAGHSGLPDDWAHTGVEMPAQRRSAQHATIHRHSPESKRGITAGRRATITVATGACAEQVDPPRERSAPEFVLSQCMRNQSSELSWNCGEQVMIC